MTTDITELAQSLKAAAWKATKGQWVAFTDTASRTFSVHTPDDNRCEDIIKWSGFDGQRKAKANAEFIALANPANVLTLVEALEKAQTKIIVLQQKYEIDPRTHEIIDLEERVAELESEVEKWKQEAEAWEQVAEKQLATAIELESRTVKLVDCDFGAVQHMSGGSTDYCHGFVDGTQNAIRSINAAGIKVEAE